MTNGTDRLDRIEALVEANATAIAAMRQQQQEADDNLRESINDVVSLIGNLAEQDDQRAAEYRQRHEEHDQRFNNLLGEAREDRKKAEQARQTNEREHQAFRESFQSLLAEIARIWQRLAG